MNKPITIRQFVSLFLFISITPMLSYMPKIAANNAGRSGYISPIYMGIVLCIFVCLIYEILRVYPQQSFYEILSHIFGSILARVILILYAIWAFFFLIYKISNYSLLIQATLSPKIHPYILISFLFLLGVYAIIKGGKTIFRFSEFLYIPFFVLLGIMFFIALPSIHKNYLVPINTLDLEDNVYSLGPLCAIGGNIFLILFFAKNLTKKASAHVVRNKLFQAVLILTIFTFCAIFISLGISGSALISKSNYSIFQTLKSVTILGSFDRLDSIITIICVFSDFICICTFLIVIVQCIMQAFSVQHGHAIGFVVLALVCTLTAIFDISQLDIENTYRVFMDTCNILFQYLIPVILGAICLFKSPAPQVMEPNEEE